MGPLFRASIFIVMFGFFFILVSSAKGEEDIQEILSSRKEDSTKIEMLLSLSEKFYRQPVKAMPALRSAFDLAEKNQYDALKARCYEYESWIKQDLGDYPSAIESSLKALRIYDQLGLSGETATMQLQIGSHFSAEKNYFKATQYISQALKTYKEQQDTSKIVLGLVNMGETYRTKGDLDSAEVFLRNALN